MFGLSEIKDLILDVEYMPGWSFDAAQHDEGVVVIISFDVPDSRNPGCRQVQKVNAFVPPIAEIEDFYEWLKWRLQRIAIHEVNEFLKIKGVLLMDPHSPLEDQFIW